MKLYGDSIAIGPALIRWNPYKCWSWSPRNKVIFKNGHVTVKKWAHGHADLWWFELFW